MSFSTEPDRWFHGKITRENAAHLVTAGPDGRREGLFLVRESLRMPGSFVLTMWARDQVHHFQVVGHGDGWFSVDNGPLFQGLDELVNHYKCRADGLPSQLHDFVIGNQPPMGSRKRLETDIHRAVNSRDIPTLKRLLSQPSSNSTGTVNSQNADGSTPVHEAAKKGAIDVLEVLLQCKPDLNIRDSKGSTPLQVCATSTCLCLVGGPLLLGTRPFIVHPILNCDNISCLPVYVCMYLCTYVCACAYIFVRLCQTIVTCYCWM